MWLRGAPCLLRGFSQRFGRQDAYSTVWGAPPMFSKARRCLFPGKGEGLAPKPLLRAAQRSSSAAPKSQPLSSRPWLGSRLTFKALRASLRGPRLRAPITPPMHVASHTPVSTEGTPSLPKRPTINLLHCFRLLFLRTESTPSWPKHLTSCTSHSCMSSTSFTSCSCRRSWIELTHWVRPYGEQRQSQAGQRHVPPPWHQETPNHLEVPARHPCSYHTAHARLPAERAHKQQCQWLRPCSIS